MMTLLTIGAGVLVALWLGTTALVVVLSIRPGFVRVVRRLVCSRGTKMIVEPGVGGSRSTNERTIRVVCVHADGERHDVKVRALLVLWGLFVLASLPVAAVLAVWGFGMIMGMG
jgi:hypothetical protein